MRRTVQIVSEETKVSQVDELAKFGGDRACEHKMKVFFSKPCGKRGEMSKRGRTSQFVVVEPKVCHVDERAEFRGDRPCLRERTRTFFSIWHTRTKMVKMSNGGVPVSWL